MSTALDLDLATLVGELEDVPCESMSHASSDIAHDGPAVSYAKVRCLDCGFNAIKAYCAPFVEFVKDFRHGVECDCGAIHSAPLVVTILGPVNGRAS